MPPAPTGDTHRRRPGAAVKLHARWTFPCTVEQFWTCFDDPDWEAIEAKTSDQHAEVLETRHEGDVEIRRTRIRSSMKLPGLVASRLGSDTLGYDLVSRIDRKNSLLTWDVVPPAMADKIVARGVMRVSAVPGGCEQVLEGEVSVAVPLVGGQIEKGVVDGIVKGHEATAKRRQAWLKQRFG
jgi:hypothetical protein